MHRTNRKCLWHLLILDRKCEVRMNFDDNLYTLIDSILPPFNLLEIMAAQDIQH